MAELLLSKLQTSVNEILETCKNGNAVEEGTSQLVDLCKHTEAIFLHSIKGNASLFGEYRGYWGYFVDCLEQNSSSIRAVQALQQNRTFTGKGRAFIRMNLKTKTLAEHVQVACGNKKSTSQHYHEDAILSNTKLSSRLVDILYNLNDVKFQFANNMSLDVAWPAFGVKSFVDRFQKPLDTEGDTRSLMSTFSLDAEKSIEQLREKVQQLRLDSKNYKRQRDVAVEDKNEADIAWNDLVSKLKTQALTATEECEESTNALAPVQEQVNKLQAANDALKQQLEDTQIALISLQPNTSSVNAAAKGIDPMQQAREVRTCFEAQLAVANSEKQEARRETEFLREESNRLRAEMLVQSQTAAVDNKAHAAMLKRHEQRQTEWVAQRLELIAEMQNKHDLETKKLHMELATLKTEHERDRKAISTLSSSLQETERNRVSTVQRLDQLEDAMLKERARSEASVSENNMLRTALTKATDEKQKLWLDLQELSEWAKIAQSTVSATWTPDVKAKRCYKCTDEFTFTNRKHHCRKCGGIFCHGCSSQTSMLSNSNKRERVCDGCYSLIQSLKHDPDKNNATNNNDNNDTQADSPPNTPPTYRNTHQYSTPNNGNNSNNNNNNVTATTTTNNNNSNNNNANNSSNTINSNNGGAGLHPTNS